MLLLRWLALMLHKCLLYILLATLCDAGVFDGALDYS